MNFKLLLKKIKFDREGLIPVVIQEQNSNQVLMLAYMNQLALRKTLETGRTHFWSRSRKKIWCKGESSGHIQKVKQILLDCDGDTLLIKVAQKQAACHSGFYSCFYRQIDCSSHSLKVIAKKIFNPRQVYHK